MDVDAFWGASEAARRAAEEPTAEAYTTSYLTALERQLGSLGNAEIVNFEAARRTLVQQIDHPGMKAAAWLVAGFDDLDDFLGGLAALGRDVFERARADPDTLAEHPVVQGIAAGRFTEDVLLLSEVSEAARTAYGQRAGSRDGWRREYDALVEAAMRRLTDGENDIDTSDVDTTDADDEWHDAEISARLPRLAAMFLQSRRQTSAAHERRSNRTLWMAVWAIFVGMFVLSIVCTWYRYGR